MTRRRLLGLLAAAVACVWPHRAQAEFLEPGTLRLKALSREPGVWARGFIGSDITECVRHAQRDVRTWMPPGTRYEIRQAVSGGAVAWFAYPDWQRRAEWVHGRPGFDVMSGTFIHERGTT